MKIIVNLHEAKTQLSRIVEEVAACVIAKIGKPIVRLNPINAVAEATNLGQLKGKIRVPDDFDDCLSEDILSQFEAR
jgi:antitoxin (DNA-binding transcriptional repressor) of toxin-antitoxin stability system